MVFTTGGERKMHKYEIWYEPRIEDPVAMWGFDTLEQAIEQMFYIKHANPRAAEHHYILDVENNEKIDHIKATLIQAHWQETIQ